MKKIKFGYIELIVFAAGFAVMVLEIIGSRIIAPYLGISIFTWSSLIGIILAALSLGYYLGGRLSEKGPTKKTLALIILGAGITIGSIALFKDIILMLVAYTGIKLGSIIACLLIFTLPSILLGMVSPYAVRLKVKDVAGSGHIAGNLYAISTVGSILGTFLTGFVLIPLLGSLTILWLLCTILIIIALPFLSPYYEKFGLGAIIFFLIVVVVGQQLSRLFYLVNKDSSYFRIRVYHDLEPETNLKRRLLALDANIHGGKYLDSEELVFNYTKFYRLGSLFNPQIKTALALGGGTYSITKDFVKHFPQGTIDVVEIDPKVTQAAREFFDLPPDPRINIFHQDARIFLNQQTRGADFSSHPDKKYDVIYGDLFNSTYSLPWHLTTEESAEKISMLLNENGVALINIISPLAGEGANFLKAEYRTYQKVFPQVYLFPVPLDKGVKGDYMRNIMLVATKNKERLILADLESRADQETGEYLKYYWQPEFDFEGVPVLTDDFAPVDNYIAAAIGLWDDLKRVNARGLDRNTDTR